MKALTTRLSLVVSLLTFSLTVFAADPLLPIGDWLKDALQLGLTWKSLGTWGALGALLMLVVNATKTEVLSSLFDKLGSVGKRLLVLLLSAVVGGLPVLAAGGSVVDFLGAMFGGAAGAMLLHELVSAILEALKPKT